MTEAKMPMAELKRIVRELCYETKALRGRQVSAREVVETQSDKLPEQFLAGTERWIALDESGPAAGEEAPDFSLKQTGADGRVSLSSYKGKRPVALLMGSYTSPSFREQVEHLKGIYNRLHDGAEFFLAYTKEMHAVDGVQAQANIEEGILFRQHQSLEEREKVAEACCKALNIHVPVLLDDMNDEVDRAYAVAPARLYVIDSDGKVAYRGGGGPHLFDLEEWGEAIEACVSKESVPSSR